MHVNKMEERRTAYALLFSIIVILVYTEIIMAPQRPTGPISSVSQKSQTAQTAPAETITAPIAYEAPAPSATTPAPAVQAPATDLLSLENAMANSPTIAIESDVLTARISLLGGRLLSLKLKHHQKEMKGKADPIEMVSGNEGHFPLGVTVGGISDISTSYRLVKATAGSKTGDNKYMVPPAEALNLIFEGTLSDGSTLQKEVSFSFGSYLIDVAVSRSNPPAAAEPLWLEWLEFVPPHDMSQYNPEQFVVLSADGSIERYTTDDITPTPLRTSARWVAFGDNYFATAVIPATGGPNSLLVRKGERFYYRVQGETSRSTFHLYSGPKEQDTLKAAGFELTRSIDLGWFAFIGQPILIGLSALYALLGNYGLAIILLTILLKTALLPLTKTSMKSMKAMQDIQPEIKALRERVKDPQQLQQEIMGLYKKRGVNPVGGCLPMLLQIPIFLGMFNALRSSIELRHASFALWIDDLAAPEQLLVMGIPIPVMVLLMGASMLLQQLTTPSTADPAQRKAMLIAPVIFTFMFVIFPVPAGLVLYFLVNNLISIAQQSALKGDQGLSPFKITILSGTLIFGIGYVLTLI